MSQPPFEDFKSPAVVLWKLLRSEIEHENLLTNYRITWLLSSQAFLFTVFGLLFVAWAKGEFGNYPHLPPVVLVMIALYACYLCLCFHDSLIRAHLQLIRLEKFHQRVRKELPACILPLPPLQYRAKTTPFHLFQSESVATATLVVWIGLLLASVIHLGFQGMIIAAGIIAGFAIVAFVALIVFHSAHRPGQSEPTNTEDDDVT